MEKIKFGPSGNSLAFELAGLSGSVNSAYWVKEKGLDCFEYSFGRGVNLSDEKAIKIGQAFADAGVEISVHAPYYVNFSNPDDEKAENSYNYVLTSAEKVKLMGGKRVVFHPASQGKATREEAVSLCEKRLKILRDKIYERHLEDIIFCPETMGKLGQIGTVEEITRFCK
ncbi:MAG: TIM barrel protein, partial [Clostridia bacterium]|nr:TIM barrel protein [Clostridia bacterium]